MSVALRPDWLRRLLSALMAEPTASIAQLAQQLGLRPSEVRLELDVFYRTELHQLPIQWWAPLARLLALDSPTPAPAPAVVAAPRVRPCAGCGVPLLGCHGQRQRCDACRAEHEHASAAARHRRLRVERICGRCGQPSDGKAKCATCRTVISAQRATTKAARPKRRRLSVDEIFARELAHARRTMHVDGWDQRGSA